MSNENIQDVTAEIQDTVAVTDLDSGQSEPIFTLIGYDTDSREFGSFNVEGNEVALGKIELALTNASLIS